MGLYFKPKSKIIKFPKLKPPTKTHKKSKRHNFNLIQTIPFSYKSHKKCLTASQVYQSNRDDPRPTSLNPAKKAPPAMPRHPSPTFSPSHSMRATMMTMMVDAALVQMVGGIAPRRGSRLDRHLFHQDNDLVHRATRRVYLRRDRCAVRVRSKQSGGRGHVH